jgi:hypothetical protein
VHAADTAYQGQTLKEAKAARTAPEATARVATAVAPARKPLWLRVLLIAGVVGLIALGAVVVLWKKEVTYAVAGHTWKREIPVERFGPVRASAWCDSMPLGAREHSRSREQRSTRQVPDGEDCKTRKVDNGNGTYSEKRECVTRYRDEPVYGFRCSYSIDTWERVRTERVVGQSASEAPRWPAVQLGRTGQCLGCEREGPRSETYTVSFSDEQTRDEKTCDFDQAKWASFTSGSRWVGEVSIVGFLDCGSLRTR